VIRSVLALELIGVSESLAALAWDPVSVEAVFVSMAQLLNMLLLY
jgi:hypothetical protein